MIAIVTVLLALPLGALLRSRAAANVVYVAVYSWAFTFQGVYLVLQRVDGDTSAFGDLDELPLAYAVTALLVYGVGFALVEAGHRVGRRVRGRRAQSPDRAGAAPSAA